MWWTFSVVSSAWIGFLATVAIRTPLALSGYAILLAWAAAISVASLGQMSSRWSVPVSAEVPLTIAAALALGPFAAAWVTFAGALDPRELSGRTTFVKAIWNRTQVSVAVYLGSLAVHVFFRDPAAHATLVIPLSYLALGIASGLNMLAVAASLPGLFEVPFAQAVRSLRVGTGLDWLLTHVAWGVMAGMMASLYYRAGLPVLPAFVITAFLGRQTLAHSQQILDTTRAYRSRETAVRELSRRIATERHDERKLIAADLHDDVVQPLFKVTLMAHVLKQELEQGRLVEMDEDLPALLAAAEIAGSTLRELIGDLRTSTLARGGIVPALSRLTEQLSLASKAEFHLSLSEAPFPPELELPIYQIAKEAVTNAAKHSRASNIWVDLARGPSEVSIEVRDDGVGWDTATDHDGHYGLHIMRERAELAGGVLYVDALPGRGSVLRATLPAMEREG